MAAVVAVVMVGRRVKVIKHIIMWFVCVLEWFWEGFEGVWKEFWKGFDGVWRGCGSVLEGFEVV